MGAKRCSWVVWAAVLAAAAAVLQVQAQRSLYEEGPEQTKGGYRVSGYEVDVDRDLAKVVTTASSEGKDLDVIAVKVTFRGAVNIRGIPNFRVYAHRCFFDRKAEIDGRGSDGSPAPATTDFSKPPTNGEPGTDGSNVALSCGRIINVRGSTGNLVVNLAGGKGGNGGKGADGPNGRDPTPSTDGGCSGAFWICSRKEGTRGRVATSGFGGRIGGKGGKGGRGGSLQIVEYGPGSVGTVPTYADSSLCKIEDDCGGKSIYGPRGGSTISSCGSAFEVKENCQLGRPELAAGDINDVVQVNLFYNVMGARGGRGGAGGRGGKAGNRSKNRGYKRVTKCSGIGCDETSTYIRSPSVRDGIPGRVGAAGSTGVYGKVKFSRAGSSADILPLTDYRRLVALIQRYYDDLLFAKQPLNGAQEAMDGVSALVGALPKSAALESARERAQLISRRLSAGSPMFGVAALTRTSPESIDDELDNVLRYAREVDQRIQDARRDTRLRSVVVAAAEIAIPRTNFNALDAQLEQRRDTYAAAVRQLDFQIESVLAEVSDGLIEAQDEQRTPDVIGYVRQGISIVAGAVGVVGSIKSGDPFTATKNIANILSAGIDIAESATKKDCDIDELRVLLTSDPAMRFKFPNLVDLSKDFSEIKDVGSIAELTKANLASKAEKLTVQLACTFDAGPAAAPTLRASINRLFINSAARLDVLNSILDIDLERKQLKTMRESVEAQQEELERLRRNVGSLTSSRLLANLDDMYESARCNVIQLLTVLVASYERLLLVEVDKDIVRYGRNRLRENGVVPGGSDYLALAKLRQDIRRTFNTGKKCFSLSNPDVRYFYFDLTRENNPGFFARPLMTGRKNSRPFVLDIGYDCGNYGRTSRPGRRNKRTLRGCRPNNQFNSRLLSMSVELIGGDQKLLPKDRSFLSAVVLQTGAQTFRRSQNQLVRFNTQPLTQPLADVPLRKNRGPKRPKFTRLCKLPKSSTSFLKEPRVCPSPFTCYELQLGDEVTPELHKYLESVRAVRIHARVSSWLSSCSAR
mmetsp:Transcript_7330/g.22348  ORF Transcript_7330/g.22348 Transcript_7330/m.22348 type:complete len:1032 (-) Transcript_7330:84-3179(-)